MEDFVMSNDPQKFAVTKADILNHVYILKLHPRTEILIHSDSIDI